MAQESGGRAKWFVGLVVGFVGCILAGAIAAGAEPKVEVLWPQGAPGAKGDRPADKPTLIICLPDFLILCYPVIAFDEPYTHRGSQENLLGKNADRALVRSVSSEKQVTKQTPPTFLFHTDEDKGVPPENSIVFYRALHAAGVPAEMHIYERGPHGVGLAAKIPGTCNWPKQCQDWLRGRGLLGPKK